MPMFACVGPVPRARRTSDAVLDRQVYSCFAQFQRVFSCWSTPELPEERKPKPQSQLGPIRSGGCSWSRFGQIDAATGWRGALEPEAPPLASTAQLYRLTPATSGCACAFRNAPRVTGEVPARTPAQPPPTSSPRRRPAARPRENVRQSKASGRVLRPSAGLSETSPFSEVAANSPGTDIERYLGASSCGSSKSPSI